MLPTPASPQIPLVQVSLLAPKSQVSSCKWKLLGSGFRREKENNTKKSNLWLSLQPAPVHEFQAPLQPAALLLFMLDAMGAACLGSGAWGGEVPAWGSGLYHLRELVLL